MVLTAEHERLRVGYHASYMGHAFQPAHVIIDRAHTFLDGVDFDTLVGTGLSGALVVPLLAREFRCNWAIVRKKGDRSHSSAPLEGFIGRRWVLVDDLVDSGDTARRVADEVHNYAMLRDFPTEFLGAYLYGQFGSPGFRPATGLDLAPGL